MSYRGGMAFPQKLLNDNEQLVLDLRPHWWFMAGSTALLVAAVAVGLLALSADVADPLKIGAAVLVVVALGYFGIRYARWATTDFVLTTDRIISRYGLLSKSGVEIPLDRVNTVFFNQSLFERMLRAGDLVIESASERGAQSFTDIRRPAAVQREIYVQIEANENRKFDRMGGGGGGRELSIPEQIEKLAELEARGVLSKAEFDAKKAALLDRM